MLFISNLGGTETIIILILLLLPTVLCVRRAKQLHQSKVVWGILGFFLNYVALLVAYILPSVDETKSCDYCGKLIMTTAKKCRHCGEWIEDK